MSRPLMPREEAERVKRNAVPYGAIYWLAQSYLAQLDGRETIPTIDDDAREEVGPDFEKAIEDAA